MKHTTKAYHTIRMLCEGALMVVLAQMLDLFPLWKMPWGGSVSLCMVPFFFFTCRWGLGGGLMAGCVLGVLQFMFAGGLALGWQSIVGDYLLAYTVLGFAGVFHGRAWSVYAGTVLGCVLRFLVHYVVGATIWAEYMPESFFGMTMTSPWLYSLLYNGFYMALDMLLCLLIFLLISKAMKPYFLGQDIH